MSVSADPSNFEPLVFDYRNLNFHFLNLVGKRGLCAHGSFCNISRHAHLQLCWTLPHADDKGSCNADAEVDRVGRQSVKLSHRLQRFTLPRAQIKSLSYQQLTVCLWTRLTCGSPCERIRGNTEATNFQIPTCILSSYQVVKSQNPSTG